MVRFSFFLVLTSFYAVGSKRTGGGILKTTQGFITKPIGPNQQLYYDLLQDVNVPLVVATGPAGCGKTLLACDYFARSYRAGSMSKLVLTRPFVAVDGEDLGFLPGGVRQKMEPWTQPVFDIFSQYFSSVELESMVKSGAIEVVPLGFMRGRSFHGAMIIADEMQNSSPTQMLMFLTRSGRGSKTIVTGDLQQSDLGFGVSNGLYDLITKLEDYSFDDIRHVHMNASDVQRSVLVSRILHLYSGLCGK